MPASSTTISVPSGLSGAFCYRPGTSCPGTSRSPGQTDTLSNCNETRRRSAINDEITKADLKDVFGYDEETAAREAIERAKKVLDERDAQRERDLEQMKGQFDALRQRLHPDGAVHVEPEASDTQALIAEVCNEIRDFLLDKNAQYGDSAIDPVRIFSKASPIEQLLVRIDDKLSRIEKGDDRIESDDDVIDDLIGYFILLKVAKRKGLS